MAGIYIHIPYCKQACIYCDFHFSTTQKNKELLLNCIVKELELRKDELNLETIETIYFGGGTPSVCSKKELELILASIYKNYVVDPSCEISLEANPDDLSKPMLACLNEIGINRLSIGIQSFFEEDLLWMHRAHNALQAKECISNAHEAGFSNISVDLIFATPLLSDDKLEKNLDILMQFNIPHLSCYNLTVEEKTNLHHQIKTKKVNIVPDEIAARQFYFIRNYLLEKGYEHYEISNYAKPGFYSKHNTAYWQRKKYLGVGPSAHSFNGLTRSWNVRNNENYIRSIERDELPSEMEILTPENKFNELILTGLRTQWGVSTNLLKQEFSGLYMQVEPQIEVLIKEGRLILSDNQLILAETELIKADSIASELFII